jgi:hypothetical protein
VHQFECSEEKGEPRSARPSRQSGTDPEVLYWPTSENVARLKQGVTAWSAWRHENPGIHPDLFSENADSSGRSRKL